VLNPEDSPVPLKVEVIRQGDDWRINDQNIGSANP
jgi:hypothetical protein